MKAIYIVLMTVFAGIFCYCLMAVFSYHRDARENKKETEEVMREVIQKVPEGYGGAVAEPKIDFEKLEQMNSDVAGWIVFHEPYVNGPLVQADDNSYYLDHSFRKKENSAGCLFMDYRNQSFDDRHVVIYGHNMLDRTMFGSLRDVFQEKFWEGSECDLIWITDRDQHLRKYKIFSCYIAGNRIFRRHTHIYRLLRLPLLLVPLGSHRACRQRGHHHSPLHHSQHHPACSAGPLAGGHAAA